MVTTTTRLSEQAVHALRHSPIPALRRVQVQESPGGLILSGQVSSYYYKQLAQETVLPLLSGQGLVNEVKVAAGETRERR